MKGGEAGGRGAGVAHHVSKRTWCSAFCGDAGGSARGVCGRPDNLERVAEVHVFAFVDEHRDGVAATKPAHVSQASSAVRGRSLGAGALCAARLGNWNPATLGPGA